MTADTRGSHWRHCSSLALIVALGALVFAARFGAIVLVFEEMPAALPHVILLKATDW